MPKKKRAAAAARAAKARAARASSQQQKLQLLQQQKQQQEQELDEDEQIENDDADESVPDMEEAMDSSVASEQEQEEVAPPPETSDSPVDESAPPVEEAEAPSTPAPEDEDKSATVEAAAEPEEKLGSASDEAPDVAAAGDEETAPPAAAKEDEEEEGNYYVDSLQNDQSYLIDVKKGYKEVENLKQPLKGFTTEDELQLFPVIESMSAKLFNIVQKMNACQKKEVEKAMKAKKGVIKIPNNSFKMYLCQMNFMEAPPEPKETPPQKRAPHPFLLTEDENMFTEDKLKMLRSVLDAGWKREVVMRSPESRGRKTGDVYYYSPDGTKFRSSKQVEKHLSERETPFTIENFTFAKVRISTNPDQEIVRKAYDGKSPPRAPPKPAAAKSKPPPAPKPESSKSSAKASTSKAIPDIPEARHEEPVKGTSRRAIQPPKRYSGDAVLLLSKRPKVNDDKRNSSSKGLMQMGMLPPKYPKGMEDTSTSNLSEGMDYNDLSGNHDEMSGSNSVAIREIAEDSLFAISALRQSGGIEVAQQIVDSQKQMSQKAAMMKEGKAGSSAGSSKRGGAVIPCSIRCPDMDGEVPTLQCIRCLCLFHAECLGLPPNLQSDQYICSNCTGQQGGPSMNSQKTMAKKEKRSPPGLAPIPHGGLRGPVPGRDVTVTLASKEPHARMQHHKMVPPSVGMARGMIRTRGGMPPPSHVRSPSAQMHHGQRLIHTDGMIPMMGGHPQMIKRGRGRPPSIPQARPLPQISKNLTITHLPRIPGAPPVPNLQPMAAPKALPGKIPLPNLGGAKPRQVIPAVPNLMKSSAFRLTVPPPSLSGRTFKKPVPAPHHQTPNNLRLPPGGAMANKAPPTSMPPPPPQDRSVSLIKKYPQSVATIGNKSFVVLPKRRAAEFVPSTTVTSAVGNGGTPKGQIVEEIRQGDTTIKRIIPAAATTETVNNTENNSEVATAPVSDGVTGTDNIDTATPMEIGETGGAGVEINAAVSEPIAATQ